MTRSRPARKKQRGSIDELPSGALRVRVHGGEDPLSGKRHTLVVNRPGFARGWGSGHLAPLGDGVSIHDFPLYWRHVLD
jgi:hypothetical protein